MPTPISVIVRTMCQVRSVQQREGAEGHRGDGRPERQHHALADPAGERPGHAVARTGVATAIGVIEQAVTKTRVAEPDAVRRRSLHEQDHGRGAAEDAHPEQEWRRGSRRARRGRRPAAGRPGAPARGASGPPTARAGRRPPAPGSSTVGDAQPQTPPRATASRLPASPRRAVPRRAGRRGPGRAGSGRGHAPPHPRGRARGDQQGDGEGEPVVDQQDAQPHHRVTEPTPIATLVDSTPEGRASTDPVSRSRAMADGQRDHRVPEALQRPGRQQAGERRDDGADQRAARDDHGRAATRPAAAAGRRRAWTRPGWRRRRRAA